MSTDEKPKSVEHSETGESCAGATCIVAAFIVGIIASLIVGWVIFPKLLYSQKTQPIDFNHAVHVESVANGCESCHYFREDGSFAGIPKIENCMECHTEVQGNSEEEVKLVEKYISSEREIPWLVYSEQPDCVFFSHAAHVKKANMDCETCHGHIGESEHARVYEKNRITGVSRDVWGKNIAGLTKNTWDRMKMDTCAACHKEAKHLAQNEACFVCHK
jgi:hypothetical protein